MSQTGPAPRPSSRRSSRSPHGLNQGLPTSYTSAAGSSDVRPEPGGAAPTDNPNRPQHIQVPPRTSGVHSILNPSEPRSMAAGGGASMPSGARDSDTATAAAPLSGAYSGSRSFFAGQPTSDSHPGTPVGGLTPMGQPPMSGRNSPTSAYPFPVSGNTRKVLSPKPPRPSSLNLSSMPQDAMLRQHLIPSAPPIKRPYEPDEDSQARAIHHHGGHPLNISSQEVSRSRSYSQPTPGHQEGSTSVPLALQARENTGRPQSLHGQPPFHHGPPVSRPTSSVGGVGEGAPAWPEHQHRSGMAGNLVGGDGQQAFMTLPGSDTLIPVQVDYSQASKKADEKRQRNAKASTRHRRKKKTLQEENIKQLQDLRDERQEMADQVEAITQQRDFYRNERNRLRDIIARTPAISQLANGPPSPTSTMSGGSYTERSPNPQPRHMPTPSQGYISESSSVERPSQRRRTDERAEYGMPPFGTPTGGHTPGPPVMMHGQAYAGPPRPHSAASSTSGDRLPPLRAMEGPPGPGLPSGQAHEQDPRTGQWRPVQTRPYETGWATGPRKPPDGPAW